MNKERYLVIFTSLKILFSYDSLFGFKLYKIDQMYFTTILYILQLMKHIYYKVSKSFKKNIQI